MSTRRRKFCAVLGFLLSVIIMSVGTVSAFAIPYVGQMHPYEVPSLYLAFDYKIYESTSILGHSESMTSFITCVNTQVGLNNYLAFDYELGDDSFIDNSQYSDVGALLSHTGHLIGGDFEWHQSMLLNSYSIDVEEHSFGVDYVQNFDISNIITDPLSEFCDLQTIRLYVNDYYVYGPNVDGETLSDGTPLNVRMTVPDCDHVRLSVVYSLQGDTELKYYSSDNESAIYDGEYVYFNVTGSMLNIPSHEVAYIHSAELTIVDDVEFDQYPDYTRILEDAFSNVDLTIDIQGTVLNRDNRNIDVQSHVKTYEFENYSLWLANAVGGFLGTEIFGGITFGGILMMVIGFFGVMWFLKVFAGG